MFAKNHLKSTLLGILILSVALLISGCGGSPAPADGNSPTQAAAVKAEKSSEDSSGYLAKIKFKTESGAEAIVIKRYADHDKIEIDYAGTTSVLKGRTEKQGRIKYKEAAADGSEKTFIAKVKIKDDSIKLVDENENLLWKVKLNPDKVKISNNEEGDDSCEIKIKSSDKGEVRDKSGIEIGNVRFYADNGKLKVKDATGKEILTSKDIKFSAGPGVIQFEHIPVKLRAIIISELIRAGK